jgi:hypothetical protein
MKIETMQAHIDNNGVYTLSGSYTYSRLLRII